MTFKMNQTSECQDKIQVRIRFPKSSNSWVGQIMNFGQKIVGHFRTKLNQNFPAKRTHRSCITYDWKLWKNFRKGGKNSQQLPMDKIYWDIVEPTF
jgi:hypothetical protein